jgi:hypothetical protein
VLAYTIYPESFEPQPEPLRKIYKNLEDSAGQPDKLLEALQDASNIIWPSEKVGFLFHGCVAGMALVVIFFLLKFMMDSCTVLVVEQHSFPTVLLFSPKLMIPVHGSSNMLATRNFAGSEWMFWY